ncbi:MAG TPA: sensor domain-containing diguanylate cyclase [Pyrinomonadaceae bacterium]|nr:sensor domain-containing diguanylate cyclase [Pyrinomonadaceae bacterium]
MYSLYHSLLAQHPRQLTPLRCGPSTIAQLHRYFEDVVLENNLGALVIESFPAAPERSAREITRIKELVSTACRFFLIVNPGDALAELNISKRKEAPQPVLLERNGEDKLYERFAVIADARFSALLASVRGDEEDDDSGDLVIWTFEPDVVYSALEYLMARVTAEHPVHATAFAKAVRTSMPKATSLQLTLGVTTKLARLLQQQAEREIAVNRIATAIRNSLDLEGVLLTAANEVGRALNVSCCMVRVEGELVGREVTKHYLNADVSREGAGRGELLARVEAIRSSLAGSISTAVVDGDNDQIEPLFAYAVVPLIHKGEGVGMLVVHSDDPARIWAENELLLLHTVADQLTVAANQAHLFAQMQQMALTDPLTGCYNRRSFELQLERDLHLATRMRQPLSLIMLDLDNFKTINDVAGHEVGDAALCLLADTLRAELRAVDTAVRFGGDEFAVILPQADTDGAMVVAERLRRSIGQTEVPGYGFMSASFGLATFPIHASSRDTLVVAADQALYISKRSGRNQVSTPPPLTQVPSDSGEEVPAIESKSVADAVK